jgi:hypothetical protein
MSKDLMNIITDYSNYFSRFIANYIYNLIITVLILILFFTALLSCRKNLNMDTEINNSGRSYYISNKGNDNNKGTQDQPFATIAKLNSLILQPGDAIYFEGGQTFSGNLSLMLNGSEQDSVYISSYGNGIPVIDGDDSVGVSLSGKYFSLSNIEVKGSGRKEGNTTDGIQLNEASHSTLNHIRVHGFQQSGVSLRNCTNILLENILAEENGFSGIYIHGSDVKLSKNIVVRNSTARNNPGEPTNLNNHSGSGILVGFSTNVLIERCTATNNGWDMPRIGNGPVGIWGYESDSLTIQYCISYKNRTQKGAKDGGGFDFDGGTRNSVLQYNLSYENEGAGYGLFQYNGASPWYNNILRYNISVNDAAATEGTGGILIWSNDPDSNNLARCYVYNNLIYNSRRPAVEFEPASLNTEFYFTNNIFIANGTVVNGPSSGEKFIGNVWWSPNGKVSFRKYTDLYNWSENTGQELLEGVLAGIQADPMLNQPFLTTLTDPYKLDSLINYKLKSNSPLKNKGIDIKAMFNIENVKQDFYGNKIPSGTAVEPGVYELPE